MKMQQTIPTTVPRGLQTSGNNSEVLRLYTLIKAWDFTTLKRYLIQKSIYPENKVDRVCDEYCRFIALSLSYPGLPLPISETVDKFWHAHIIFTENYRDFSDRVAGVYIDHRPAILDNKVGLTESFSTHTLQLYSECFGDPNPAYWDMTCCKRCTCHAARH